MKPPIYPQIEIIEDPMSNSLGDTKITFSTIFRKECENKWYLVKYTKSVVIPKLPLVVRKNGDYDRRESEYYDLAKTDSMRRFYTDIYIFILLVKIDPNIHVLDDNQESEIERITRIIKTI